MALTLPFEWTLLTLPEPGQSDVTYGTRAWPIRRSALQALLAPPKKSLDRQKWQSITITLVEKVQIIAVFLGSLFLVASISWLLWSALSQQAVLQRRDVLFQICYGMYGFMDLVCIGLIVHKGAAVYNVFMRWRAVNLHWDVQSYNKAKDMEETSTGHSSLNPRTLWLPLATFGPSGPLNPTQLRSQPCAFSVFIRV
ncbi:E3 ubiquitin-protein ligase MARCHF11-like [Tautogolabrus adspersus]